MMVATIYLAGPLFTQAERRWNSDLKEALERLSNGGASVTLPQVEAEQFVDGDDIDLQGIYEHCLVGAVEHDVLIAVLDGPDPDSGTCVELAFRKGRDEQFVVIGVRTDFRGAEDPEIGTNAMLRICDEIVRFPAFNESIDELALEILNALERNVPSFKRST